MKETNKTKIEDYLQKTSLHTFKIKGDDYLKVVPIITKDNIKTYIIVKILPHSNVPNIDVSSIESIIKYYDDNAKNVIKNNIFLNKKSQSIKKRRDINSVCEKIQDIAKNMFLDSNTKYNLEKEFK